VRWVASETEKETEMNVRAELHCYHCGYQAARIEATAESKTSPLVDVRLVAPSAGPGFKLRYGKTPFCGRCGGPLYLDEIEFIRYAPTVIVPLPPGRRRGRPPKSLLAS